MCILFIPFWQHRHSDLTGSDGWSSLQRRDMPVFCALYTAVRKFQTGLFLLQPYAHYLRRQILGNIILRSLGVRNWLTFCVIGWGAVQLGMAFVPTWGYLVLCRILLGIFEVKSVNDSSVAHG